jgi:hypothetical protein
MKMEGFFFFKTPSDPKFSTKSDTPCRPIVLDLFVSFISNIFR